MSKSSLKTLMQEIHGGRSQPAIDLAQKRPDEAAVISKLVQPHVDSPIDLNNPQSMAGVDQGRMTEISDRILERSRDSDHILQLFPDIELAIQLVASSVISPKDMVKNEIIYKSRETIFPASVMGKMNDVVKSHVEGFYKLKDDLYDIVRDAMFMDGCYIKMTLPESTVDYIINNHQVVSTESISGIYKDKKFVNRGFLGDPKVKTDLTSSLESMGLAQVPDSIEQRVSVKDMDVVVAVENVTLIKGKAADNSDNRDEFIPGLEIIDNFEAVRLPKILEHNSKMKVRDSLLKTFSRKVEMVANTPATEDVRKTGLLTEYNAGPINYGSGTSVKSLVYGNRPTRTQMFSVVQPPESNKRRSVGRPLTMRLPACSVIPVYVPGDEKNHVGYFVLLDVNGNPLNEDNRYDALGSLQNSVNQNQSTSLTSSIIERATKSLIRSSSPEPTLPDIEKVFISIVENNLLKRLKHGVMGDNVTLGNNEDIYRIMLARCYAGQQTRVMFVPAELITYYAFKHFNNGVGKSYMDDIKILISMRASVKLAKIMALLKSSIAITRVNVDLDPRDADPLKTVETVLHEIARVRSNYLPLGTVSPTLLTDWVKRAGFEVQFSGHPKLPSTKIDFESKNFQPVQPDNQLEEDLRRQTYMAFALTPEMVDESLSPQFATTVTNNNTLFSKRVMLWQAVLTRFMTKEARTYSRYDGKIYEELKQIVESSLGLLDSVMTEDEKALMATDKEACIELLIERFIENMELDLPKPDTTTLANQIQAFDDYVEALDKTIKSWVGAQVLTGAITGDMSNNVDEIAEQYKHHFIREYMVKEGLLTELADVIKLTDDGKPEIDLYKIVTDHNKQLAMSCLEYIKSNLVIKDATNKDLANMNVEAGTSTADTSDTGSGDEFGGGDDFGGGMDVEFDDSTDEPTEEVVEEPTPDQPAEDATPEATPPAA